MRFAIFLLQAIFLSSLTQAQTPSTSKSFVLSGNLKGQNDGMIHLWYTGKDNSRIHDSCRLTNGTFTFKGNINDPTLATVYGNVKSRSINDPNITEFFLEPGKMQIELEVDNFKKHWVTGSKTEKEYAFFINKKDSLNKAKPVFEALQMARANGDTAKVNIIVKQQLPAYTKTFQEITFDFINAFPASFASSHLLMTQTQNLPVDSLKYKYLRLAPKVQQSGYGMEIKQFIEAAEKVALGKPAPHFEMTDLDGQPFSLKQLKGKYVLLDFWASWCLPCRQEHPHLKEAYNRYSEKGFGIVSISLDVQQDKQALLEAIRKDDLTWKQLCDFKGWESTITKIYNLLGKGIPANFLIDPTGKIIATDLRGDALKQKLATLL